MTKLQIILFLWVFLLLSCRQQTEPAGQIQISSSELQPDDHFKKALREFANKNYEESAQAIREAIAIMQGIMDETDESRKDSIQNSIAELRELADHVAIDQVDGLNELNYFFARAGESLAGLHMHVSETEYFNLQGRRAGAELEEALNTVEEMMKYHGRALATEEMYMISQLREQVKRLKKGEVIAPEEMEKDFKQLNDRLNQISHELELKYVPLKHKRKTLIHDKP